MSPANSPGRASFPRAGRRIAALALAALLPIAAAGRAGAQAPPPRPGTTPAPAPGGAPAPTPPPSPGPSYPGEKWQPRGAADLSVLEKVNGRSSPLQVRVGQSARFGSLTITVRSCLASGPEQPKDATAYLDIQDSRAGASGFHGWMLVQYPFLGGLESPVYDLRLTGCR